MHSHERLLVLSCFKDLPFPGFQKKIILIFYNAPNRQTNTPTSKITFLVKVMKNLQVDNYLHCEFLDAATTTIKAVNSQTSIVTFNEHKQQQCCMRQT